MTTWTFRGLIGTSLLTLLTGCDTGQGLAQTVAAALRLPLAAQTQPLSQAKMAVA